MRVKLFGVCALSLAGALLFAVGASSQPAPGGKDKPGAERVSVPVPVPGYGTPLAPDGDLSAFDLRQLMDELVRVRQEQAALARREQALLALIPKRIDAQRKELNDLERRLGELQGAKDRKPEGKK